MAEASASGTLAAVLKRAPRLSRVEERRLIIRAQAGDERARQAIIEGNLRLVLYVAKRYHSSSLSLEDMVQEGVVGLVDALERYDPGAGHSFSSYAVPWIRLRIGRAVYRMNRLIRLPERSERLLARWNQLCEQTGEAHHAPPCVEDAAGMLGVTPETLQAVIDASGPITTLHPVDGDGDSHTVEEYVTGESASDPWLKVARDQEWKLLRSALEELRPNYRQVIEESYGLNGTPPRTLNELATQWGVTKQAVSGLRKRALDTLRERMAHLSAL